MHYLSVRTSNVLVLQGRRVHVPVIFAPLSGDSFQKQENTVLFAKFVRKNPAFSNHFSETASVMEGDDPSQPRLWSRFVWCVPETSPPTSPWDITSILEIASQGAPKMAFMVQKCFGQGPWAPRNSVELYSQWDAAFRTQVRHAHAPPVSSKSEMVFMPTKKKVGQPHWLPVPCKLKLPMRILNGGLPENDLNLKFTVTRVQIKPGRIEKKNQKPSYFDLLCSKTLMVKLNSAGLLPERGMPSENAAPGPGLVNLRCLQWCEVTLWLLTPGMTTCPQSEVGGNAGLPYGIGWGSIPWLSPPPRPPGVWKSMQNEAPSFW